MQDGLFDVAGKTCVVTGAGGALAGSIARALGERGVNVVTLDIDEEAVHRTTAEIENAGGASLAVPCDVLDVSQLERAEETAVARFGPIDFLVNGAGGNRPDGTTSAEFADPSANETAFFDLSFEGMQKTMDLNYFGTVLPSKVFSRGMVSRGRGSILNIASVSALHPLTKVVAYSSAKAAIANFTKWLAVHYSRCNVRVNALAPGFIMTEQLRFLHVGTNGEYTPRAKKALAHTPAERYGTPTELIGAALWLLSDSASFVTGSVVAVDGGFSSYSI